jgi:hypothetical protein
MSDPLAMSCWSVPCQLTDDLLPCIFTATFSIGITLNIKEQS